MLSVAIVSEVAPPPPSWIEVHTIPQDLILGVIATFVGLVILFSIKPRLKIDPLPVEGEAEDKTSATGDDDRSETFSFRVKNRRLRKVIEVKVRLLRIRKEGSRKKIDLVDDELFELRGKLSPLKPGWWTLGRAEFRLLGAKLRRSEKSRRESAEDERNGIRERRKYDRKTRAHYTFFPKRGKIEPEIENLGDEDYILVQVIAKDAFTGFTRLKRRRFYKNELRNGTGHAEHAPAGREQSPAARGHSPIVP
jgi:hypothetical protein